MKWLGICLLVLLGLLLFLLVCPAGVRVDASDGSLCVYARVLGIPIRVYPRTRKKKKNKAEAAPEPVKNTSPAASPQPDSFSGTATAPAGEKPVSESTVKKKSFTDDLAFEKVCDLLSFAAEAIRKVVRVFYIPSFRLYAHLHADDAAKTALLYGGACSLLGAVMPQLRRVFRICKEDIRLWPDFEGRTSFVLSVTIMTVPLRLMILALTLLFQWYKRNKK